jgi:hypothetical protein
MRKYQAPKCPSCGSNIGRDQKVVLTCIHSFHKECLRQQALAHVSAGFSTKLSCSVCNFPIDGSILEQLMSPQDFHKYNKQIIPGEMKMEYCPNCEAGYYVDPEMQLQQAPVKCKVCEVEFCAVCRRESGPAHDFNRCKEFVRAQMQVMELEKQVAGETIAQCPTCKVPFIKDENYQHIQKCITPGCPDWNFCCSSLRQPCLSHSTHWHRPDCQFASTEDISQEPWKQDCPECVRLNRRCDPPPRLKVPRRFR